MLQIHPDTACDLLLHCFSTSGPVLYSTHPEHHVRHPTRLSSDYTEDLCCSQRLLLAVACAIVRCSHTREMSYIHQEQKYCKGIISYCHLNFHFIAWQSKYVVQRNWFCLFLQGFRYPSLFSNSYLTMLSFQFTKINTLLFCHYNSSHKILLLRGLCSVKVSTSCNWIWGQIMLGSPDWLLNLCIHVQPTPAILRYKLYLQILDVEPGASPKQKVYHWATFPFLSCVPLINSRSNPWKRKLLKEALCSRAEFVQCATSNTSCGSFSFASFQQKYTWQ